MIEIEHLTKVYGTHEAVSDLSFRVESGQIYGFLGPNGAGKSTTMNIMTGCLSATSGQVRIDGYDIFEEPQKAKKLIGYLPEHPPLYPNETPLEYLRFVGEAKGLRGEELERQIGEVVAQTKIESVQGRRICTLSRGFQQRVGIAQALLGNPSIIVLEEPTVGLDPIPIIEIRALIKELGHRHTVIFSSHILSEVQNICDQILILSKGHLVAFDTPENLERQMLRSNEISLVTEASPDEALHILCQVEGVTDSQLSPREDGLLQIHLSSDCDDLTALCRRIFFAFAGQNRALLELSSKKASLEDVFVELTEQNDALPEAPEDPKAPESSKSPQGPESSQNFEERQGSDQ